MKKILNVCGVLLTTVLFTTQGFCADANLTFISNEGIELTGTVNRNSNVVINVMKNGYLWNEETALGAKSEGIVYYDAVVTNDEGKYSFLIGLDESNLYTAYVNEDGKIKEYSIEFADKDKCIEAVGLIIANKDNTEELSKILTNYRYDLTLGDSVYGDVSTESTAKILKNSLIGKSFTTDDYEEIIGLVKSSAVIEAVNEDKIEDLNNYIDYLGLSEYEIENFWSEEKADEIKERLGNSYGNIEEFLEDVKEAVCLVKIKYADGYGEVRDVVGAYQELINVRVSEITDDLCRNLQGKSFKSFSDLKDAIDSHQETSYENNGGGGSSSGGSSTGGISAIGIDKINLNKVETIIFFDDLDNVSWAKDAIENLAIQGIVTGKEEKKFYPQDAVKREEFVSMIVRAFNLNGYDKENVFDDVLEGAWYEDAIMKAYYSNIINGMSENQFGIGLNITRQDMCVIVYNTLQLNKSELLGEREVSEFLDEANIADYAITAVKQLQKEGIVSGDSSGYFNPLGNATRAETAVVMNAVLKYIK